MRGILLLCALTGSLLSFSCYAAIPYVPSKEELQRHLQSVQSEEEQLHQEIHQLQSELSQVRKRQSKAQSKAKTRAKSKAHIPPPAPNGHLHDPDARWVSGPEEAKEEQALHLGIQPYGYFSPMRFRQGITVTTSPLLGLKSAFDASDLLYQYPSMNEDLILLRQRQYLDYLLSTVGDTLQNRAILMISGGLEGQMIINHNFDNKEDDDINLSTANLDVAPFISSWADGLIALNYDSSPPSTGSRVTNSRIYLSRGFLTIGNLNYTPLYFTIGQIYAPFGRYSSLMLTTPLTESMARLEVRAALLGFYDNGFYAQAYGFQGNKVSGLDRLLRQGGVNAGYQTTSLDFGAGYVSNIADSQGMQNNGIDPLVVAFVTGNIRQTSLAQFGGFGETPGGEELARSVPALDWHLEYAGKVITLLAEFISATNRFSPTDMTFNNVGAAVKALHTEIDFNTSIHGKPVSFGFVYGQTWQALALNLPKNTYAFVISASIWKNTMMGIEYRHDINYAQTPLNAVTGVQLPVPTANVGGTRNMVTLQFGAYF